jgi:hypothetical protein
MKWTVAETTVRRTGSMRGAVVGVLIVMVATTIVAQRTPRPATPVDAVDGLVDAFPVTPRRDRSGTERVANLRRALSTNGQLAEWPPERWPG